MKRPEQKIPITVSETPMFVGTLSWFMQMGVQQKMMMVN